jgi:hypothetical protein
VHILLSVHTKKYSLKFFHAPLSACDEKINAMVVKWQWNSVFKRQP